MYYTHTPFSNKYCAPYCTWITYCILQVKYTILYMIHILFTPTSIVHLIFVFYTLSILNDTLQQWFVHSGSIWNGTKDMCKPACNQVKILIIIDYIIIIIFKHEGAIAFHKCNDFYYFQNVCDWISMWKYALLYIAKLWISSIIMFGA